MFASCRSASASSVGEKVCDAVRFMIKDSKPPEAADFSSAAEDVLGRCVTRREGLREGIMEGRLAGS
jgi:hypothetical protein